MKLHSSSAGTAWLAGKLKSWLPVITAGLAAGFFLGPAAAQDYYAWQEKLKALDQKCEDARAKRLAPVRAALARECENEPRRGSNRVEECMLEYSTYGNNSVGAQGGKIEGLFYDLPECTAASRAWKEWDKSQPWKN